MRITAKDGNVYTKQIDIPLGSPERPMTFDDCVTKFRDCASYSQGLISGDRIDRAVEMIRQLESLDNVTEVVKLLS